MAKKGKRCWTPMVARYSKKDALALAKKLRKYPKLSVMKNHPKYTVRREKHEGEYTDRWIVMQDCETAEIQFNLNME